MAAKNVTTVAEPDSAWITRLSPVPLGGSLPLADLLVGLDEHAAALGATPTRYTRPAGWPSRMNVPTSYVVGGRWQPRSIFVESEILDLADSIMQMGIVTPLLVFVSEHGKLELIAGERRLRAAKMVGLSMVPVEIMEGTPAQLEDLSIIDNVQRENLKPWEEGAAFERMIAGQQISEAECARRMGKNRAYVQQRRALGRAAPTVIEALSSEQITLSMARGILTGAGDQPAAQSAAVAEIIAILTKGKPINETAAKGIASAARLKVCINLVKGLGWQVYEHYSGITYLWGGAQRPQPINAGSELLTAIITQQARPAGQAPEPWVPDDDVVRTLKMRGYTPTYAEHFTPWVACALAGTPATQYTFWAGSEMAEAARTAQHDMDAQDARVNSIQWKSIRDPLSVYFVKGDKRTESCYSWESAEKLIATLTNIFMDRGKATVRLSDRQTCAICNRYLDIAPTMWHQSKRIHVGCKDAAIEAEKAQILSPQGAGDSGCASRRQTSESTTQVPGWIQAIPASSVRALVWMYTEGAHGVADSLADCYQHMLVLVEQAEKDFGDFDEEDVPVHVDDRDLTGDEA